MRPRDQAHLIPLKNLVLARGRTTPLGSDGGCVVEVGGLLNRESASRFEVSRFSLKVKSLPRVWAIVCFTDKMSVYALVGIYP